MGLLPEKEAELQVKLQKLQRILAELGAVAVAFSGGVDSSLLLKVACDLLGWEHVLAITATSPFFPAHEGKDSQDIASLLGVRQEILQADLLQRSEVTRNDDQRCYHCKKALMSLCLARAAQLGFSALVDGSNLDDLDDYRPGSKAARELGVRSPLQEAGLSKQDIRALSRRLQLPTADKPAFACLASRIPYGSPIRAADLARVERCEAFLHQQGLRHCRARHHGTTVRIEVSVENLPKLVEEPLRSDLVAVCKNSGYRFVALDLEGYRTGSLNEELSLNLAPRT